MGTLWEDIEKIMSISMGGKPDEKGYLQTCIQIMHTNSTRLLQNISLHLSMVHTISAEPWCCCIKITQSKLTWVPWYPSAPFVTLLRSFFVGAPWEALPEIRYIRTRAAKSGAETCIPNPWLQSFLMPLPTYRRGDTDTRGRHQRPFNE